MNLRFTETTEGNRENARAYLCSNSLGPARIPRHMVESIVQYVCEGNPIGDFLTGVFTNSLVAAGTAADDMNKAVLGTYALMLCQCPRLCYGDAGRVSYWKSVGGFNGIMERTRRTELPRSGEVSVLAFVHDHTKVDVHSETAGTTTVLVQRTFRDTAVKIVSFCEGEEYDSTDPKIHAAIEAVEAGLIDTVPTRVN